MVFDPGSCLGRLRGCPFLGGRHVLLSGWVCLDAAMVSQAGAFCGAEEVEHYFNEKTSTSLRRPYCRHLLFPRS